MSLLRPAALLALALGLVPLSTTAGTAEVRDELRLERHRVGLELERVRPLLGDQAIDDLHAWLAEAPDPRTLAAVEAVARESLDLRQRGISLPISALIDGRIAMPEAIFREESNAQHLHGPRSRRAYPSDIFRGHWLPSPDGLKD